MRAKLSDESRHKLFASLKARNISYGELSKKYHVSPRTVSNWSNGKSTLPLEKFYSLATEVGLNIDQLKHRVLKDWWNNSSAGKLGSQERIKRHGNLGDNKSRRKGGLQSYRVRKDDPKDIFAKTTIIKAPRTENLAEFVGIMIGDGGITKYQVEITTNSEDDSEYSRFVSKLMLDLFGLKPNVSNRKDSRCTRIVVSSKELVDYLQTQGLNIGDKLSQGLDIPGWVKKDVQFSTACLRGIFDTDGSIYQECHLRKNKKYCYSRLSFVSMSPQLRRSISDTLKKLGFASKIRGNRCVMIERQEEIDKYFQIIGSNNPKHLRRYRLFGEVG